MTTKCRIRIVNAYIGGVQNDVFSKFGDLGGDFFKETHEPNVFGMLIGSVLSGLEAGNVNTDHKMPNQECEPAQWRGKNDILSEFGEDFYNDKYEPKLFGMHMEAGNVNSDQKMPNQDCERVHWRGQK